MTRTYSDREILAHDFPDPRMKEADHRPLRQAWYRQQGQKQNRRALVPAGWVGRINAMLRVMHPDAIDAETEDV